MNRRILVVFDGDDTLWRTQEIYDAVKARFVDLVARHHLRASDALSILGRIDSEAVQMRGFTVDRFVGSMVQTYRSLAAEIRRQPMGSIENQIRELAQPLLGDYDLYPDTVEVLERLSPRFELVLATKGQRSLQEQKVRRLGIGAFFSRIYFIERKTDNEYRQILASHQMPASRAWAIGNSVRSDINPALKVGMHAIWIRRRTWSYEEEALDSNDVAAVDSLREAADVLLVHERERVRLAGAGG